MEVLSSPESTISLRNIEIISINGSEVFDYSLNGEENQAYELIEPTLLDLSEETNYLDLGGDSNYIFFGGEFIREIYDYELSNDDTKYFYFV